MRRLLVSAILLLALLAVVPPPSAAQEQAISAVIGGPTAIAPSSIRGYNVTVTGGPAQEQNGTFQIDYVLTGDNLKGGDPLVTRTLANKQGVFRFNVTAPSAEGDIVLYVKAKSSIETRNTTTEARLAITVARPVGFRVTIRNEGAAAAENVTVLFYVDNVLVANTTVRRIEAGGSVVANASYLPVGLADGRHVLKVTADLNRDGKIQPDELTVQEFFYKSERSVLPTILGTLTVLIIVILVFLLLAIRRQRRQG